jgi:hypothetical protein
VNDWTRGSQFVLAVNPMAINAPLIATFGSINADITSFSDQLPQRGQTVTGFR